jgi:single-strand selective monofunctional uracil DNA glycosylase
MEFEAPVEYVYNPLEYARAPWNRYIERFGRPGKEVVFVGMNPGPYGMAQTGVPFGEITAVRDWMAIEEPVGRPEREHPKRPIVGFDLERSEISGARLWGWAQERFGPAERFFERFFAANFCPLVFMEGSGRNRTPDKLPAVERDPLFAACDRALRATIEHLRPKWVIGIGVFAEGRAKSALGGLDVKIGRILHPSPASPIANRGWAERAEAELRELGIAL